MKLKITLILVLVLVLFGCATPYQPVGYSGGYAYERISENVFVVNFHGNGFTNDKRVRDFCLLRCAEMTTEFRFKFFTIEGEINEGEVDIIESSSTTTTTGTLSTYGNTGYYNARSTTTPNTTYVYKPGITYIIRCYDQEPIEGHFSKVYDATQVADALREKYKIKDG